MYDKIKLCIIPFYIIFIVTQILLANLVVYIMTDLVLAWHSDVNRYSIFAYYLIVFVLSIIIIFFLIDKKIAFAYESIFKIYAEFTPNTKDLDKLEANGFGSSLTNINRLNKYFTIVYELLDYRSFILVSAIFLLYAVISTQSNFAGNGSLVVLVNINSITYESLPILLIFLSIAYFVVHSLKNNISEVIKSNDKENFKGLD